MGFSRCYTIGVDYGSASVRAIIVDIATGRELASGVYPYQFGEEGNWLDRKNPNMIRQNPEDYTKGLEVSITMAIKEALKDPEFCLDSIVGIGIDTTGTTVLPVLADGTPLASVNDYIDNPNAYIWLWKDHTATQEAVEITKVAMQSHPHYIQMVGGSYSSEWYWAKVLHCLRIDRAVFNAAYTWMEVSDWLPFLITGKNHVDEAIRNICAASHKALYNPEWGGYPDKEFFVSLDPALLKVHNTLSKAKVLACDQPAGMLSNEWTARLGLSKSIVVATSAFDAHFGGIGAGVRPGNLVKTIGTSTCDLAVIPKQKKLINIEGMAGIVHDSIIPGYFGIEAGQSAVGDIFNWFVSRVQPQGKNHKQLGKEASTLRPGESGLLALDWLNGNRTILGDQRLSGMIIGLTLHSTPAEIYNSLIEATAFGARIIHEQMESHGIPIEEIVVCGGIPRKDTHLMQIYADICKKPLKLATSLYTCALGGAIAAAVCAGIYPSIEEAINLMTSTSKLIYYPREHESKIYDRLYALYKDLHNAFGRQNQNLDMYHIMKGLLEIKKEARELA